MILLPTGVSYHFPSSISSPLSKFRNLIPRSIKFISAQIHLDETNPLYLMWHVPPAPVKGQLYQAVPVVIHVNLLFLSPGIFQADPSCHLTFSKYADTVFCCQIPTSTSPPLILSVSIFPIWNPFHIQIIVLLD